MAELLTLTSCDRNSPEMASIFILGIGSELVGGVGEPLIVFAEGHVFDVEVALRELGRIAAVRGNGIEVISIVAGGDEDDAVAGKVKRCGDEERQGVAELIAAVPDLFGLEGGGVADPDRPGIGTDGNEGKLGLDAGLTDEGDLLAIGGPAGEVVATGGGREVVNIGGPDLLDGDKAVVFAIDLEGETLAIGSPARERELAADVIELGSGLLRVEGRDHDGRFRGPGGPLVVRGDLDILAAFASTGHFTEHARFAFGDVDGEDLLMRTGGEA